MKKGLTELVFILDRSGSMNGLEKDTIGGFNSLISKQKKEDGEAFVSTVLFDDESEVIYDRVNLKDISPMTEEQYYVRGCTALLDAVGGAVKHIGNVHKYAREEDRPEKTIFVITTDGMENSSKIFTYEKVKKLIEEKQEAGWQFIFLGANMDAVAEAGRMGIDRRHAVEYECDEEGTARNFEALDSCISYMRDCEDMGMMSECMECFDDVREYRAQKMEDND